MFISGIVIMGFVGSSRNWAKLKRKILVRGMGGVQNGKNLLGRLV